jgi:glycosyltransferase involved in cell wall biosynthesis
VATERFAPGPVGDHYLVLSELVSHKRIDVAIEAFNRLRLPLVVAGDGPDRRRLRRLAGPTIRFAGRVSDDEVARLLSSCRALVVTAGEEFGIAAVEAQAAGRPVLARAAGGLLENVIDGVTGRLWDGGSTELAEAVLAFDTDSVDADACVENARRFDSSVFRRQFPREVEAALREGPPQPIDAWPRVPRRLPQARRPGWAPRRFGA